MEQENLLDLGPDWGGFDNDVRAIVGKGGSSGGQSNGFRVAGSVPERLVFPGSISEVCKLVQSVGKRGLSVVPLGLCAHAAFAGAPDRPFVALSTSRLKQTIEFESSNMTLTVESGVTLESLQGVAGRAGQWLPLDPPLESKTTVGGLIAANLSGPARFSQGTVRDFLIGCKVVASDGAIVKGGGRVVKNVAGYDLPKLFCGSEGTLGIIVEATFKLRPRPEVCTVLRIRCDTLHRTQEVLRSLLTSTVEPSFLELVSFVPPGEVGYNLVLGFFGSADQVTYQVEQTKLMLGGKDQLQEISGPEAQTAMQDLRDFRVSGRSVARIRANLLPTKVMPFVRKLENQGSKNGFRIALQAHAGNGIVHVRIREGQGARNVDEHLRQLVERLRNAAEELGGSVVLVEAPRELKARVGRWGSSVPGAALMWKIKKTLDPKNIFSPGRFLE